MHIFEKSSFIKCSVKNLYDFHLNSSNLVKITPKDIKVTLLNDFQATEGSLLRLKVVKNFIPIFWEVKIEKLKEPDLLIDVALKSPFKEWRHSHMFTQVEENLCELRDTIEYSLPFEPISSFMSYFIDRDLESMFTFRHQITQKILEEQK